MPGADNYRAFNSVTPTPTTIHRERCVCVLMACLLLLNGCFLPCRVYLGIAPPHSCALRDAHSCMTQRSVPLSLLLLLLLLLLLHSCLRSSLIRVRTKGAREARKLKGRQERPSDASLRKSGSQPSIDLFRREISLA